MKVEHWWERTHEDTCSWQKERERESNQESVTDNQKKETTSKEENRWEGAHEDTHWWPERWESTVKKD